MGWPVIGIAVQIQTVWSRAAQWLERTRVLEPTLAPILLAVVTLAMLIPASRYLITNNLPLTVSREDDMRAYVSMRLLQKADSRPAIFNLGGSSLLRAVDEDSGLERKLGGRFDVFNLSTPSQSMVESWLLLQRIDLRPGDLVVMHVNISRLNNLLPEPHWVCSPYFYSINTDDIIAVLDELGVQSGTSPLCHVTWLSRRAVLGKMMRNALSKKGPPVYRGIYPLPQDRDPVKLEEMRADRLAKQADPAFAESWLRFDHEAAQANAALVARMHRYVTGKKAHFVLLDLPMNHDWFRRYHGQWFTFEKDYQETIDPLRQAGVDYRDLRTLPGFGFDDYYDQTHFVERGRDKFFPYYERLVNEKMSRKGGA